MSLREIGILKLFFWYCGFVLDGFYVVLLQIAQEEKDALWLAITSRLFSNKLPHTATKCVKKELFAFR